MLENESKRFKTFFCPIYIKQLHKIKFFASECSGRPARQHSLAQACNVGAKYFVFVLEGCGDKYYISYEAQLLCDYSDH